MRLGHQTESNTQATMVFIDPSEVDAYEDHLKNVYQIEGRPEETGISDFGFGIWKPDLNMTFEDGRLHDTTGKVGKAGVARREQKLMLFFFTLT